MTDDLFSPETRKFLFGFICVVLLAFKIYLMDIRRLQHLRVQKRIAFDED